MSVVNIPADKTVATIEIGNSSGTSLTTTASYPTGVAVTPDGSRAYVTDGSTSVWVVDTKLNSAVSKIASGTDPERIAITPDGKRAYVTTITCGLLLCSGPGNPPELASVNVIDTGTNSLVSTITFGQIPATLLSGVTISPDGTRAYVTPNLGSNIWVIDTATNGIIATISTAASGFDDVSASPDGRTVYAIGWRWSGTVTQSFFVDAIDTHTDIVTASITLSNIEELTRIAVTPDGGHAYVIGDGGHVWVIDTVKNAVVATVPVASVADPLLGIAFTPDGTRAYVTCGNTGLIYVLDATTNHVVDTIQTDSPSGLAISRAM
jgi:YVTN family beta-propeller protein